MAVSTPQLASCVILVALLGNVWSQEKVDVREGADVSLQCRFPPPSTTDEPTLYWLREDKTIRDNVAIGPVAFSNNYKLDYRKDEGVYDLKISNASYEHDNGIFECRIKQGGTGRSLHAQSYLLTVLTPPRTPIVAPGNKVTATEGKRQEFTCSSDGGSPEPSIVWYKEGSPQPLEASIRSGKTRDQPTVATLSLIPTREDDGAIFRCVVWNRAMVEGARLEATVALTVNYFPRIQVGPENPLRVEQDSAATLECNADAKPRATSVRWLRSGRVVSAGPQLQIHRVGRADAGRYTCTADNGLGRTAEQDLLLDVLYPPAVRLPESSKEVEEGDSVFIKCNVTANPSPHTIEWVREGLPDFRQSGDTLRLTRATASDVGTYTCRAANEMGSNGRRSERWGNASVALVVRHKPGRARVTPERPVVTEGESVTLSCMAEPPGWPAPNFKWSRPGPDGQQTVAAGSRLTIPSASLSNEGTYFCHAANELGPGEMATVSLQVHQPPRFVAKPAPTVVHTVGDSDFSISCSGRGKPRPSLTWLKDGREITPDAHLFEVRSEIQEGGSGTSTVTSVLRFSGKARTGGSQLMPADRGVYTCSLHNEIKTTEASTTLRIEHAPIILHQYNKVANDLHETAEVVCKIQAYPKPEFRWFFGSHTYSLSSDNHYESTTSMDKDDSDVYTSVLRVSNIKQHDYGEYICQVVNKLGRTDAKIYLQPKGPPEKPKLVSAVQIGPNYVTLSWEPGFNGGAASTKYFVFFRKVPTSEDVVVDGCGGVTRPQEWSEIDCDQQVPCNITSLDQHQTYVFKVKALNTKGNSDFSEEVSVATKVDRIPVAQRVAYDPSTRSLSINLPPSCLSLVAVVESMVNHNLPIPTWHVVDTIPLILTGSSTSYKEAIIDALTDPRSFKTAGRSIADIGEPIGVHDDVNVRVRVKLCLRMHHEQCGDYTEAEIGSAYIKEASTLGTPTLIATIVSCIVFILFVGLLVIFCRCKRNQTKKGNAKDYEMDSIRPTIVTQQSQAPPPYYPSTGMENKALEHSMDLALNMDDTKSPVYASQNGYGYHIANPGMQGHQNINGEWVNVGYMENSYSNSNNGGSVDSQDSLWQMKMAAAAAAGSGGPQDRQGSYGYDPVSHGGYGADDYAAYPTTDDYLARRQEQYCTDPYAAVHKPKKRLDQHIDSPYHDVSGLPDPYLDQMEDEKPPQHMSLNYEESLESGYSTPNSRTRRVIREIIV